MPWGKLSHGVLIIGAWNTYKGEIIVAEKVDAARGLPLPEGISFRIVFFTVPRRIAPSLIKDSRIAMVAPRRTPSPSHQTIDRELRAVRETRVRYVTAHDPVTVALKDSMQERETALQGELARRYALSYSMGRTYTHSDIRIYSREIFMDDRPESWANRLASAVLLLTYPSLPINGSSFPHTLASEDIAALYRGMFQGNADATAVVRAFGPGLGLTRTESPNQFDAGGCLAVEVIGKEVESRGGEAPADQILDVLTRGYGVTLTLAGLYLMAFVRQEHAEVELGHGHQVEGREGKPFLSDRITWDLVPEVSFSDSLLDQLGVIRLRPSPTWDTALPYATLLVEGLKTSLEPEEIADQERRLLDVLGNMTPEIANIAVSLRPLEVALDGGLQGSSETLESLRALSAVSDYREFYFTAQERFRGPVGLREALESYALLRQLTTFVPDIVETKRYLDLMAFGREHQELSFGRKSILAMMEPDNLAANPSLWKSIEEEVRGLRVRYTNAYVSHHVRYHQEAIELSHRLEKLRPQVEALVRFSEMVELGQPVGTEVPQLFKDMSMSFNVCSAEEDRLTLEAVPYCETCLLRMDENAPSRDAEILFGATEKAMREYNRRLSSHGVRQILAHPTREQIDQFINLVQVADPSALVNVLDDEVVEFLRRFLKDN